VASLRTVSPLLLHALAWGLALSAYMTAVIFVLARIDLTMWLNDYPPDVRERFGPMSAESRRRGYLLGLPAMAAGLAIAVIGTLRAGGGEEPLGFGASFLHMFVVMTVFNLVDLIVLDWLVFVRIRPRFLVLPGTEDCVGYDDDAFHFVAFLKGTVLITVLSALVAAILSIVH